MFPSAAQTSAKSTQTLDFSYCFAEHNQCSETCTVKLIRGKKIELGAYIKVYWKNQLITEGYILKHVSGTVYILKNKKDAANREVCGGCCGGAFEIRLAKKQVWGC